VSLDRIVPETEEGAGPDSPDAPDSPGSGESSGHSVH
jgi:hypothetical protein